jgi:hypothetical protein
MDTKDVKTEPVEVQKATRSALVRKWFFYILIGGLIVSALISIIAVLIGEVNDVVMRALWTTVIMVVHSLVVVGFLSAASNNKNSLADEVILNTLITLTVASFMTSVFGTWEVFSSEMVADLYQLYFYALFASILIFCLLHARLSDPATAISAKASIGIAIAFVLYLIPSVFDNTTVLPDMYYRGIAAFAILLSTTVVITVIYQWVYAIKHRDELASERAAAMATRHEASAEVRSSMPTAIKVLLIVVAVVFATPIVFGLLLALLGALVRFS